MNSIKMQIIERLLALAEPLKTDGELRKIARVRTVFLLEPVKPALHLVVGDEVVVGEDDRGYTLEFPVGLKLIFSDASADIYTTGDALSGKLQQRIESDTQLNSLANWIKYEGETPFSEEELKPGGGVLLNYVVNYRRLRAAPETNY